MKNINRSIIFALFFLTALLASYPFSDCAGQTYRNKIKRASIGIQGGHYDLDAGIGLQVTTPLFVNESFAFRFTGSVQWLETYYQKKLDLIPYNSVRTGLVYNLPLMDRTRIYFEGGYYMILPNRSFSSDDIVNGGYGLIGAEFFFYQKPRVVASFFVEMGFTALDATAERLLDERSYGSGLVLATGFRFHPFGTVE